MRSARRIYADDSNSKWNSSNWSSNADSSRLPVESLSVIIRRRMAAARRHRRAARRFNKKAAPARIQLTGCLSQIRD